MAKTIHHPALAPLKARFPEIKLLAGSFREMTTVVVPRENLIQIATFLRDDAALRYEMLFELNGVDYLNYPGATHRFAVNYGLLSLNNNNRVWLKVFFDPEQSTEPNTGFRDEEAADKSDPGLRVASVTSVWPGAEWMEREVYDLFGIVFTDHPDLRRLLTWNGFGSHPLRKDYPLRGVGEREKYTIITRQGA